MHNHFEWGNFKPEFLKAILESSTTPSDKRPAFLSDPDVDAIALTPFVSAIASLPSRQFVLDYRGEIERWVLRDNEPLIVSVFGRKANDNPRHLFQEILQQSMGEVLANRYITALGRIGYNNPDWNLSDYTHPVTIDLSRSGEVPSDLFDHQKAAVDALGEFINGKKRSGILVMPPGSGKTRTAVTFLLEVLISKGYQVLWLAHRHMLIDQAANQFVKLSPLLKSKAPDKKTFTLHCASGLHGTIKALSKQQDVQILSVATAVRNLDYLNGALKQKVIVVVDEAHHTSAPSYRRIIDAIRKRRPDAFLMGLTATPVRMTESGTQELYKLFEGNFIHEVAMGQLIGEGILAEPQFTQISTGVDFEPEITPSEGKYIDRVGDLPETLVQKIAVSRRRNDVILEQYFSRNWGRTLIFALNIVHARLLTEELQARGVRCGCIYSGQENNHQIIQAFAEGKLDVLVNINILTEGSDVPGIDTVFLTRPTQSEGLLVQMIGRGMRGKLTGGTERVDIVDFADQWDVFTRWLNPEFVFTGITEPPPPGLPDGRNVISIPWSKIRALYRQMGSSDGHLPASLTIPYGWYELDNDGEPYTLLVFEHQLSGYVEMIRQRKQLAEGSLPPVDSLLHRFFPGMSAKPAFRDMVVFLDHLRQTSSVPHLYLFQNRRAIDPYALAEQIIEGGADLFETARDAWKEHEPLIRELYGPLEEYTERIFRIINYRLHPVSRKIEEMPIELIPFAIDGNHDLAALYAEVKAEMADELGECVQDTGTVTWTDRPVKSLFGCYNSGSGNIEINCLLNSTKVQPEVLKYLLYHEMLHRRWWAHDKTFRNLEHRYPNYTEYEKFLDSDLFGNFRFEY